MHGEAKITFAQWTNACGKHGYVGSLAGEKTLVVKTCCKCLYNGRAIFVTGRVSLVLDNGEVRFLPDSNLVRKQRIGCRLQKYAQYVGKSTTCDVCALLTAPCHATK